MKKLLLQIGETGNRGSQKIYQRICLQRKSSCGLVCSCGQLCL